MLRLPHKSDCDCPVCDYVAHPDHEEEDEIHPERREGGRSAEVVGESPPEATRAKSRGGTTLPRASDELRRREGESDDRDCHYYLDGGIP